MWEIERASRDEHERSEGSVFDVVVVVCFVRGGRWAGGWNHRSADASLLLRTQGSVGKATSSVVQEYTTGPHTYIVGTTSIKEQAGRRAALSTWYVSVRPTRTRQADSPPSLTSLPLHSFKYAAAGSLRSLARSHPCKEGRDATVTRSSSSPSLQLRLLHNSTTAFLVIPAKSRPNCPSPRHPLHRYP